MKTLSIVAFLVLSLGASATTPPGDPRLKDAVVVRERPSPNRVRELTKLPSGLIVHEANYLIKDGKTLQHGAQVIWRSEGSLSWLKSYDEGVPVGVWLYVAPSGRLVSLESYEKGRIVERREFHPSGAVSTDWRLTAKGWLARIYDETGSLIRELTLPEGKEPNKAPEPTP